jgi:flagellar biosynthesis/type III secretory pathway M-ring protein FliF/YscJ
MSNLVLGLAVLAVAVIVASLLWIFLRPARSKPRQSAQMITRAPAPVKALPKAAPKKAAAPKPADGPSVEIPHDKSSTRWVGKMIDEHPDEAAAVLRRWIQEK